jgi:hypothetical protein
MMEKATAISPSPGGLPSLKRLVAELVLGAEVAGSNTVPLELLEGMEESAQLVPCEPLGGSMFLHHPVGAPTPMFRAFLDGKQRSEQLAFVRGIPLIVGTVGAVIRNREGSRATTWRVARETMLYAPLTQLQLPLPEELSRRIDVVDTDLFTDAPSTPATRHPVHIMRRAYHMIQRAREGLEQSLVIEWSRSRGNEPLLIDGSISRISSSGDTRAIVGLVKSHRTMYLRNDEVESVLSLAAGERSSSFLVESRGGPVASWYLRLRRSGGCDPLWGLVRVEIPVATHSPERANEISRWVLAEVSPISLPDSRWDRLLYGVRDCETFLSAVM